MQSRAIDNLRYIRETMEKSASFTNVSGLGGVIMGIVALTASVFAWRTDSPTLWLGLWLGAAGISLTVATMMMARKSRLEGVKLLTGPGRKFAWNVIPPLVAGWLTVTTALRCNALLRHQG